MTKLHISDSLLLPRDTVTSTVVIYGGKGMGKTNLAAVIVEELAKLKLRWAVLDPVGVWWGLRHAKDGRGPGVECLILGGGHGDIPIEPTGGGVVADLVADESVNVIIDFSRKPNGESWGVGEKIRFVTDYGKRLFQRQSSLVNGQRREPLFQMIDEAARFIPQMIRSGQPDLAMCLSIWSQIVEEGRNAGLGVGLVTQRSARLNKDVAELADAMIAFRTVGPNSVDAVMDWLGEHVAKERIKEIVAQLRSLPVGSGLVVSPGWLEVEEVVHFRERETFDSSATPKPGESAKRVTGAAAKPDLEKYSARMQETIQRQKENDPAVLKAKIRELDKKLLEALVTKGEEFDPRLVENAVAKAVGEQQLRFNEYAETIRQHFGRIQDMANDIETAARLIPQFKSEPSKYKLNTKFIADPRVPRDEIQFHGPTHISRMTNLKVPEESRNGDVQVKAGARRMLAACVQWHPKAISESQVAAQAGVKRTSGTFSQYRSTLIREKLVEVGHDGWRATGLGVSFIGVDARPPASTTEEVLALWMPKFKSGARRMLEYLVTLRGRPIRCEDLGSQIDPPISHDSGTFSQYLGHLRTADLIVQPERGYVAANKETLFL